MHPLLTCREKNLKLYLCAGNIGMVGWSTVCQHCNRDMRDSPHGQAAGGEGKIDCISMKRSSPDFVKFSFVVV